jgi:hypothetical protein
MGCGSYILLVVMARKITKELGGLLDVLPRIAEFRRKSRWELSIALERAVVFFNE